MKFGDFRIDRVQEFAGPFVRPEELFPDYRPGLAESIAHWAGQVLEDGPGGRMLMSFHSFLLRTGRHTILVDTCCGNDKERPARPQGHRLRSGWLTELARAGVRPEEVDVVMCTHLHWDHVGWNTQLVDGSWVPTFPNARYLFGRIEWDHWRTQADTDPVTDTRQVLDDSVRPIFDAGLATLVETDHRITDAVRLEPTPGHTPGHLSVRITSRGAEAVITGDLMHHPVQCCRPDVNSRFDVDPDLARRTRRAFLADNAARGALVLGTHFPTPTAGRLVARDDGWELVSS